MSSKDLALPNSELIKKMQKASQAKHTIRDFVEDFLGQFISKQTQKAYVSDLDSFFNFLKTAEVVISHPGQIQGHHFQVYRDELIAKGYSSATINRKLVGIRSFVKWAMSLKLMDHNPLDVVKLPKVQTEAPTQAFTDEEVTRMLNAPDLNTIKGQMHRVAMLLLFTLGPRRSELANIRLKDIYEDRGHWVLKIKGKGDKNRHLPLNPKVLNGIKSYIEYLADNGMVLTSDDYLIQSNLKKKKTEAIDGSTIYRIIQRYARDCGIHKKVSPHSCRATVISHLLDTQHTPIRDVAIFAGHSNITTTERYDKRREALENSAAYKVDYDKKSA